MRRPRIAITMGDPAGVGPELCLKLLADVSVREFCDPVVYGDTSILRRVAKRLGFKMQDSIRDIPSVDAARVIPGQVDATCGKAAFAYFDSAITHALAGTIDATAGGERSTVRKCVS